METPEDTSEASEPLTQSWSSTESTLFRHQHTWTLKNFDFLQQESVLTSSAFFTEGFEGVKWILELNSTDSDEDSDDFVSLFLRLESCDRSKVSVKFRFTISDSRCEQIISTELSQPISLTQGEGCGFRKFVPRNSLLSQIDRVAKDELSVFCEILVAVDTVNVSSQASLLLTEAPESIPPELPRAAVGDATSRDVVLLVNEFHAIESTNENRTAMEGVADSSRAQKLFQAKLSTGGGDRQEHRSSQSLDAEDQLSIYTLPLEKFRGGQTSLFEWWHNFKKNIHDRLDLNVTQKFTFLKNLLDCGAASVVRQTGSDEADYIETIDNLFIEYGDFGVLSDRMVRQLLKKSKPLRITENTRLMDVMEKADFIIHPLESRMSDVNRITLPDSGSDGSEEKLGVCNVNDDSGSSSCNMDSN